MLYTNRLAAVLALSAMAIPAHAQSATQDTAPIPSKGYAANWPGKPIRVLVGAPAGGTSDILTRLIGAKLTEVWGQPVISDTRPGANGNIAAEMLARAAPDGYTLMLMDIGNLAISPSLYKLPFDSDLGARQKRQVETDRGIQRSTRTDVPAGADGCGNARPRRV